MQIGLRQFSADTVERLGQAVSAEGASRSGLAAELCEREGWHNAGGDPCVSSARKVLPRLAAKLGLSLPAFPDVSLEAKLKDLGEVSLEPVSDRVSARRFRAMMASHHPELELTARGGERAGRTRTATLEFRIARVDLMAAAGKQPGTLPLTAVLITEPDPPPESRQPLRWLLLSSEGDATAEWAVRICRWYETRRSIEEYFHVLKTGTCIEDRRLDDADGLRKSLAFDAITAWRVFELERAVG